MKPIKNTNFGDFSRPGNQIVFQAFFNGQASAETAWCIKQVGVSEYLLQAEVDPTLQQRCYLVQGTPTAPGQCQIVVTPFGGAPAESARKLETHIVQTFEDNAYSWQIGVAASAPGQATVSAS